MNNFTKRLAVAIAGPALALGSLALASPPAGGDELRCSIYVAAENASDDCAWYASLPRCVYEDGNIGNPCIWTSPRGLRYYVTGEEYR